MKRKQFRIYEINHDDENYSKNEKDNSGRPCSTAKLSIGGIEKPFIKRLKPLTK